MKPEVVIEVVNDLDIGCSKRQVSGGVCGGIQEISYLLYGTSQKNLKKMQSLIVTVCKLLRSICVVLKKGIV